MSEARYGEWMARGRNHQWEGRPLDAMQCFRRAAREWPRGVEARFHLGETLWQLGRLDEAVQAWRDATGANPDFLAAWQALSEASLGLGDAATAYAAAARVLEKQPRNERAHAVQAIARLTEASVPRAERCAAVIDALAPDATWLAIPALGGSLAVALEDAPDDAIVARVAAAARRAAIADRLHARLHALICEQAAREVPVDDTWFAAMAARTLDASDHDALRRAARAAACARAPSAVALATAYGKLCIAAFRPPVSPQWPSRTAGARPRIIVLFDAAREPRAAALVRTLAADADVTLARVGDAGAVTPETREALALPTQPAVVEARRLALIDADLLVDLVGLDASIGPLLAQRLARRVVEPADLPAPLGTPLVDERFDADATIDRWARAFVPPASASPAIAELEARWREAVAAHQGGDRAAAAAAYERVLQWQPGYAPALYLRAMLAREAGDLVAARHGFDAALEAAPRYDEARSAALSVAGALHDRDGVSRLSADIVATAPPALLRTTGLAWLAVGDGGRGASFFEAALRQEPSDGETHYNLGVALQMQRRFTDAARAYQRALVCKPDLIAADFNLGVLFTELGNRDGAIAAFTEVLRRDAGHVAAHKNLGEALLAAGRIDDWLAQFRRFERACPDALPLAVQALEACHYAGDFAGVERYLDGLRRERFVAHTPAELADALEQLLYLLLYFDVEPEMERRFAETYDQAATQAYGAPLPRASKRKPGRIRIGYLSADLRNHVMGKMMYQAIRHHDRTRFAVHLYALSPARDEWTERFEAVADKFTPLADADDATAVERIAGDDLDILVDLNTHTKGARPALLARKPARLAITHVASAGAAGLRAVDFKLTDHRADLPENQAYLLETLLPMDGCVYPYRHIAPAPAHDYTRAALGILSDAVVIGAFVNPLKLSRRTLALWRDVLARIPRARLAFSPLDPGLQPVYRRLAGAAGIGQERLVFVPASADEAVNQARYALVDFVLDPMPFGGVNGTLEALGAGVPVVTLAGKRHGERTSYSILASLGVTATVAETGREYVELAVRLADDASFRGEVRDAIRAGLAHSPLTDMIAHTRNLEAAYLQALARVAPEVLEIR